MEGTCAAEMNVGGMDGGSREEKPTASGGEEEEPGSEVVPSWLWLLLKVQVLPFILLRLPMELRMTVARLMDSLDRSRLAAILRSRLVLIRFCKSDEKVPAYVTELEKFVGCGLVAFSTAPSSGLQRHHFYMELP